MNKITRWIKKGCANLKPVRQRRGNIAMIRVFLTDARIEINRALFFLPLCVFHDICSFCSNHSDLSFLSVGYNDSTKSTVWNPLFKRSLSHQNRPRLKIPLVDSGPICCQADRKKLRLFWPSRQSMTSFTESMAVNTATSVDQPCKSHKVLHCTASKVEENKR